MKVVIVGSQASIHIIRWANALVKKGIEVHVFSMHTSIVALHPQVKLVKLPFRNPFGYLLNIPFLRKELKKIRPDVIHSFYALGHGFLGRMTGYKPHIISVLGSDIYDDIENPVFRYLTLKNLEKATLVCSTSHVMARQIKNYVDLDIKIIPFGVNTNLFSPSSQDQKKLNDEFVIGTVKWLEDKYGIDILISSFAQFRKKYLRDNIKLIIVGDGSKKHELKRLTQKLNIEKDCTFVGRVDHSQVHKWLEKFDIFAALSRLDSESFGVAILEASSMEIPVLVSDVGGLPEVVINSETGIVIPNENIEKATEALEKLYLNRELRKKLGEAGRKRVLKHYSWDESVKKMIDQYEDVLEKY